MWKCRHQKCEAPNANWLLAKRIVARLVAYVASAVKNNQGERFGRRVGFPYLVTTYRAGFCRHCHLCCAGRPHTFLLINAASSSMSCRKQSHALVIQKAACVLYVMLTVISHFAGNWEKTYHRRKHVSKTTRCWFMIPIYKVTFTTLFETTLVYNITMLCPQSLTYGLSHLL